MPTNRVDIKRLQAAHDRLGDAIVDPDVWPELMEQISAAVGATGAILLQTDARTADVPRTVSVREFFADYFQNGWEARDVRAQKSVPLLLSGKTVVIDQDILSPEEIARDPLYNECGRPHGFGWFAAVGFRAGSAFWGMVIQRTLKEGLFDQSDKRPLAALTESLTAVATLATAVGRNALSSATDALSSVRQAAIAIDRLGFVLGVNPLAEALFDEDVRVRNRRLFFSDAGARKQLDTLTNRMRVTHDFAPLNVEPFVASRAGTKPPVAVHILPVPAAARSPFLGARTILSLTVIEPKPGPTASMLKRAFKMTPAEAQLASLITEGHSLDEVADQLGIARETARNQLKAVFAKTGTHRQGELIALLAKL